MIVILLLISYANIWLKTSILYYIVLNFNKILTFKNWYHADFKEKAPSRIVNGALKRFKIVSNNPKLLAILRTQRIVLLCILFHL